MAVKSKPATRSARLNVLIDGDDNIIRRLPAPARHSSSSTAETR
jgi:hypothetical protein